MMIEDLIVSLIEYGLQNKLISRYDVIFVLNRFIDLFKLEYFEKRKYKKEKDLDVILENMVEYALKNNIIKEDTGFYKDSFDTKIMGVITPKPSYIIPKFKKLYNLSPKKSTDYFYKFNRITNDIRVSRIKKDMRWKIKDQYGLFEISINLSKPEKDPKQIAKDLENKNKAYPLCVLCRENEGFYGGENKKSFCNHRVIPIKLCGEQYFFQYSPYAYYKEHSIVFKKEHTPMKIEEKTFFKLLDFVRIFPHYFIGSNADLPLVGGSILSHDHFQAGRYIFAIQKAPFKLNFKMRGFLDVNMGFISWPLSVIRLQSKNLVSLGKAASKILNVWQNYDDESVSISSHTGKIRHNTITPIARKRRDFFEFDLILRNNKITEKDPFGIFNTKEKYHNIKKENIGLIEAMGLAVLPARLKIEMALLKKAILEKQEIGKIDRIKKHRDWAERLVLKYKDIGEDNIDSILKFEIGKTFVEILGCCAIFKEDEDGENAMRKFVGFLQ